MRAGLIVTVAIVLAGCNGAAASTSTAPDSGAPSAGPSSPSVAPSEASPRPAWLTGASRQVLEPGVPSYFEQPLRVTFSVPSGWSYVATSPHASFLANAHQTAVFAWLVTENLYGDPCHWQKGLLDPALGPSADDLVTALGRLSTFTASEARPTEIGGLPATSLTLTQKVRGSTCDGSQLKVWSWEPTGNEFDLYDGTITLRVLTVGGKRLVAFSWTSSQDAGATSDIEAIVRSIRFS